MFVPVSLQGPLLHPQFSEAEESCVREVGWHIMCFRTGGGP